MRRLKAILIFVLVVLADLNFVPQNVHNPQQITRGALAISLSEGRLDIDRHAYLTVDKAEFNGHTYADKPPGLSLLAVPGALIVRALLANIPGDHNVLFESTFTAFVAAATFSTNVLLGAFASVILYLLVRRYGAGDLAAVFAAFALALATPFFPWSTVLFAHAGSGSVLLIATGLTILLSSRPRLNPLIVGVLLGYLLVIDLTMLPAAVLVGIFFLTREKLSISRTAYLVFGGIVGIGPLLMYNALAFGSPFTLGYSQVVGFEGMKEGLFGLTTPNAQVLWEILFGLHRGLLPLAPILALVPLGLWRMFWNRELRSLGLLIAGTIACSLLINSSYFYWDGGSSTGPRHLVAMLPLASVALAFAWPRHLPGQIVALALLVLSLVVSAMVADVEVFVGTGIRWPFFDYVLPRFFALDRLGRAAPLLIEWIGFAALMWWGNLRLQRYQLPTRPFDAPSEIELQQQGLHS
jgi:hypothetical protein